MKKKFTGILCISSLIFSTPSWATTTSIATPPTTCAQTPADVVLMLDRSGSIDRNTELQAEAAAAKLLLDNFATFNAGYRIAVGAFAINGAILPGGSLTTNYTALKQVIDNSLDSSTNINGTNLEDAIQVAQNEVVTGSNSVKFIVLISDGQTNLRNTPGLTPNDAALQAATTAKSQGIKIITLAFGSSDGSTLATDGRALLAAMASSGSIDNTSGAVDNAERDAENRDGDHFYIAPNTDDLSTIFSQISQTIVCDDNNLCSQDTCNTGNTCGHVIIDSDHDGTPNCQDVCPLDPTHTTTGPCDPTANVDIVNTSNCDMSLDSNNDGLPDVLDPIFSDFNGDFVPDCCLNNNGSNALFNFDSDGDGIPNCQEFVLGTNPIVDDASFQGSATDASFSGCSLPTQKSKSSPNNALLIFSLILPVLMFWKRRVKSKKSILFFIFFLLILVATQNKAMAINVQNFAPADGVGNGFSLYTSQTLKSQEWLTGMYINYDEKPLEIGLNNNDPRVAGIVDRFVTADAIITYGVLDNLNVTVDVPFNLYYNIAPTLVPTRDEGNLAMGDLRMSAKWQIVDALTSESHWGLALVPFLTVPTGNETIYFGSSSVTGGGIVAGEKRYGPHSLYMNAGARFQKQEQLGDLVISNAWLYGIGYKRLFSEEQAISGILEIQGSTTFRKFYHQEITSPAEFRAIIQKNWLASRRLHSYLGGGTGLTNGYGSPDFRLNAGVTFSFGPMP